MEGDPQPAGGVPGSVSNDGAPAADAEAAEGATERGEDGDGYVECGDVSYTTGYRPAKVQVRLSLLGVLLLCLTSFLFVVRVFYMSDSSVFSLCLLFAFEAADRTVAILTRCRRLTNIPMLAYLAPFCMVTTSPFSAPPTLGHEEGAKWGAQKGR